MKNLIVITGMTASGKTSLAIQLAKKIDAEIICADSRIVYKNLDIVSAKPTIEEQEGIKHHLIDIKTVDKPIYSAGEFCKDAKKVIESTDKNIIITGGTWFYIKALLDETELLDIEIDKKQIEKLELVDGRELWDMLFKLDSKRAREIHPNNKEKIIRAILLSKAVQSPISSVERPKNRTYDALKFMPEISRETLYDRINQRVDIMVQTGLFEEWQSNKEKYGANKIMLDTIGYKEFYDLENGVYKSEKEAIEKIKQHTRNFAKRQMTYFNQAEDIIQVGSVKDISERCHAF